MDYLEVNKEAWDKRTRTHITSEFYNVPGFLKGEDALQEIEIAELTDVAGQTLLHLQCHFGMDTLSWARRGAVVTGVDLSPAAIEQGQQLARQTGLDGRFVCADVYEFGEKNTERYDIVFTSYGALVWLPDLDRWARTVANSLKPGGRFYIAEFHPVHDVYAGYAYFHSDEPDVEEEGTYTENDGGETSKIVTWAHPLSEVINALINAGIRIERMNEFPFSPYNCFEGLEEREPGRYYYKDAKHDIPLVYTILGRRVEDGA